MLLRTIGDKGNDIFDNFSFEADAQPTFVDVFEKFDQFCKPRVSVFTARNQFLTMKQNTRSIDEFLTALKKKVRECTFGDLTDDMVLHALPMGLDQERTRRRLFETENLTLDKAIGICRLAEDTEVEMKKLHLNEEVSALYRHKPKNRTKVTRGHTPRKSENYVHEKAGRRSGENYVHVKAGRRSGENYIHEKACRRCGTSHLAKQCPAWGKECYACKKKNHFSKFCRTNQVHLIREDSDSDILHIKVDNIEHKLLVTVNVLT